MESIRRVGILLIVAALSAGIAGCSNKVLDPTQIGRFRPTPAVNVILDSLGVAEEPAVAWEAAEEPRPDDVHAVKTDYVLQPGDVVRVSIFELLQEGVGVINDYVVTETGKVSIPEVGPIQAAGLTETQLEAEIRRILSPNILREASVTVALLSSQQRAFSILGNGVPAPGRYFIPRYDFRLMDALATAGVQMQFNVSNIYVSRREGTGDKPVELKRPEGVPELELIQPNSPRRGSQSEQPALPDRGSAAVTGQKMEIPEPSEPAQKFETEREMLDMIAPQARSAWPQSQKIVGDSTARPPSSDLSASMLPGGFRLLGSSKPLRTQKNLSEGVVQSPAEFGTIYPSGTQAPRTEPKAEERMEWLFEGGQWKQVPARSARAAQPPAAQPPRGPDTEWVLRNGNWVQVPKGQGPQNANDRVPGARPTPVRPPAAAAPRGPTLPLDGARPTPDARRGPGGFESGSPLDLDWEQAIQTRSIRIPADRLLAGDRRYNLVIKPGDTVHVPVDLIGEFFIMGNVNRTGVINLTGRPMTLKMAIAAAGGLGPLAYPKYVEVTRRIGMKKEEIVMVDLDKIASGDQPDFFIKPNDLINVGTDATSRWRAVLRNAFRAAYGFGFVYDRNFADADFGKGFQLPHWF